KLYVGNLNYSTRDEDLEQYFSSVGPLSYSKVMKEKLTGKPRGFAFVAYAREEDAHTAIASLDNREFAGRRLLVNVARPPGDAPPRRRFRDDDGGGGGGGYGGGGSGGGGYGPGEDRY
ncbi:unnamed protein product, partial [Phaeothamnion confervicola]